MTPMDVDGHDPGLLLSGIQRTAADLLGGAVDAVLRRTDDYLFDHSQGGAGEHELTALRDLRRARPQVSHRYRQVLAEGFRAFAGDVPAQSGAVVLSLLTDDALEEQLAQEQISEGLSRLHAPALELVERRLAALMQRAEVSAEDNPIGPLRLATCLRDALHAVELSTGVRIVLCKFYERQLATTLGVLYEQVNATFAAAGILPQLKPTRRADPSAAPAPSAAAIQETAVPEAEVARVAADTLGIAPADQALFTNLIGLLTSWRRNASGAQGAHAPPEAALGGRELLSVLSMMQPDPPASLQAALDDSRTSLAEHLRREVLAGARRMGMGGDNLGLSEQEEDAVDLVGMLFDVLLDERHFEPDVRRRISRLLLPYVKVAVRDRRMFLSKGHPARRLLNAVAEACEGNHGDGPQERELLDRVDATIDRLVAEYNEDLAIFETLEQELRAFMDQHRKRIEIAERRAAETQRGRERLERAREAVSGDLAIARGTRPLPPVIDDFVGRCAHHHLTQVALREGAESPRYSTSLLAVRSLLVAFDHAELGAPPESLPSLEQEALLDMLSSSGCVGTAAEEALATIRRTLAQLSAGEEAEAHAAQLPADTVVPAAPPPEPEPLLTLVADRDKLDVDPDLVERLRNLPLGTWVQLTSDSGRVEPAKVSWVSPISARLMFVNRRGIRVLVASAEELAAMVRLDRLRLREADNAFEDAMHRMTHRLQTAPEALAV
jgi:hypothetical protein